MFETFQEYEKAHLNSEHIELIQKFEHILKQTTGKNISLIAYEPKGSWWQYWG